MPLNHVVCTISGKDYKLRLGSRNIEEFEAKNGSILQLVSNEELPVGSYVALLHASLQALQHGITKDACYSIFDAYIDEGHDIADFIKEVLMPTLKVSGYFKKLPLGEDPAGAVDVDPSTA